jgi:hypothetical protein
MKCQVIVEEGSFPKHGILRVRSISRRPRQLRRLYLGRRARLAGGWPVRLKSWATCS